MVKGDIQNAATPVPLEYFSSPRWYISRAECFIALLLTRSYFARKIQTMIADAFPALTSIFASMFVNCIFTDTANPTENKC